MQVLTWNLYHGRDFPPDPGLFDPLSRFLRIPRRNATHVQVNRNLFTSFASVLRATEWDVALLQEVSPRWAAPLAAICQAQQYRSLTSRNSFPWLRGIGQRLNPDLIGSNEGGSNLILVRGEVGAITERRELVVAPGPEPERRTVAMVRLGDGAYIAGGHLSAGPPLREVAERELVTAAAACVEWAAGAPLVLGGDLNLRPQTTDVFAQVAERFGLVGTTAPDSLDHLLHRDLDLLDGPRTLGPEAREVRDPRTGLAIRLSDHAPVVATFRGPG